MKNIILSLILAGAPAMMFAQTSREEVYDNIQKAGGVYYAYPTTVSVNTPAPKGYKPFYISHYGRHGSRYLISDRDYEWVINSLRKADKAGALSDTGKSVLLRLDTVWNEVEGRGGDLSPLGVRQHRGIAERMIKNYPEVFKNNSKISARSTIVVRCVLSMDAFCERLKEINPTLDITRESSNRYMKYLNYHGDESNKFTGDKGPWREEYRKFESEHTNPQRMMSVLFNDANYVRKNVNPEDLMWGLYWIAVGMQDIETPISFYDIFTPDELFDLWQCVNYRFYVCDANYKGNNGLVVGNAANLLENIIESADKAIADGDEAATLRFGHDGNLLPLTSILRLDGCYESIDNPENFYQVFSDFKIAPMAGNLQMIFYKNPKGGDVLVKFLLNEQEKSIPVATDKFPYYNWNDVKNFYQNQILPLYKK